MKFKNSLLYLLGLLLVACGGGGGGSTAPAPSPAPPPAPAPSFPLPTTGKASADSPIAAACGGGSGTLYANAEVEPWLAIHPSNPDILAGGWQQDRWGGGAARATMSGVSLDGGQSWRRTLHPFSRCGGATTGSAGDYERASDPWVDFGPSGILYAMALAASGATQQPGSVSAMLATRSLDNGQTWEPVQTLVRDTGSLFHDKNALTADPYHPAFVYGVWDRLDSVGNGPTLMARSQDAGASWEPARAIYTPIQPGGVAQTIGNRIVAVAPGVLVNVFVEIDTVGGVSTNWVGVVRSTNNGQSWGTAVRIAEHRAVGTRDPQNASLLVRDGAILPSIAVGSNGRLWVSWHSAEPGGRHDRIVVATSDDGGISWTAPRVVNQRTDVAAFTPTLAAGRNGQVGLLHFDLREDTADPSTLLASAWLLTSSDGITWRETKVWGPVDLSQAPNARGYFLGDYMGLVARGDRYQALLALPQRDANNRTDVFLLNVTPATTSQAVEAPRLRALSANARAGVDALAQQRTQWALAQRRNAPPER
ncbi:hypothetical protein HNQ51_001990 [Inhella inkyongensis]|uniref:Sialidase domain-containing protein n=1 Tax=Inhella inkyongensis TaxID=392593 RepID=A0A840S6Q5_9BURK|nr:sialidase family protein [Inhella inkyongensis]MBB5204676.1 hypothetical protein [Inhella inkyongensis]